MLEKFFKLKENNTTVRTEFAAGLTTFMTMAYILAVNPSILGDAGMDPTAVFIATCLASFVGSVLMAFMANMPFVLSAGMGLNAFFAYTVVLTLGYSWQVALLAVFVEGLVFIFMSLTNMREAIFNSIPLSLKNAVSVGVGIYIAFIGLKSAGIIVANESTFVALTDFRINFSTAGICSLLALGGTALTAIMYIKKVRGAILFGILSTWGLGIVCQLTGIYVPTPEAGFYSLIPTEGLTDFTRLGTTFGQCFHVDFSEVGIFNFIVVVFSFLFVDLFDTLGTVIGVSSKAGMLDEEGRLPAIKPVLMADALATTVGAVFGTSTTTTFVESSAGVAVGGRTGLTALFAALFFLASTLFAPVFTAIPAFATTPALVVVGFLMFTNVIKIALDSEDFTETIPAYLCVVMMPLTYSISEGIIFGILSYVLLNLACGKKDKLNPILYVLSVLFIMKYLFL